MQPLARRQARFPIWPLFALLLAPGSLFAQTLDLESGYRGFAVSGGWAPITAVIRQPKGVGPWRGRVEALLDGNSRPACASAALSLSSGATERITVYLPMGIESRGYRVRLIREDEEPIASAHSASIEALEPADQPLHLVFDDAGRSLSALNGFEHRGLRHRVVSLSSQRFPRYPWALDGIAMVTIASIDHPLSEPQLNALEHYVSGGGVLLCLPSERPAQLTAKLRSLLPAWPAMRHQGADRAACELLGCSPDSPPVLCALRPLVASPELLPSTSATPLLAGKSHGSGYLAVASFDPEQALLRSNREVSLLLSNLTQEGRGGHGVSSTRRLELANLLRRQCARLFEEQEVLDLIPLLLALLSLGIYAMLVSHKLPRRWPLTLSIPLAATLFSALIIGASSLVRPDNLLRILEVDFAFERGGGAGVDCHRITSLGLLAGESLEAEIEVPSTSFCAPLAMSPLERILAPTTSTRLELGKDGRATLRPIELSNASFAALRLEDIKRRDLPVSFVAEGDGSVNITNLSGRPIGPLAVLLQAPGKADMLKLERSLAPGETVSLSADLTRLFTAALDRQRQAEGFWSTSPEARQSRWLLEVLDAIRHERVARLLLTPQGPAPLAWLALLEDEPTALTARTRAGDLVSEGPPRVTILASGSGS